MKIAYTSSVQIAAGGWRSVRIVATADRLSPGMARVLAVETIDGDEPTRGMSRTGARRQEYDGRWVARREVGARKRLSACEVIAD